MHLPRAIALALATRQLGTSDTSILPTYYCLPSCSTCKLEITAFNTLKSCAENSAFINSCGNCQLCVIKHSLTHPGANTNTDEQDVRALLANDLNRCKGTAGEADVERYQSGVLVLGSASQSATTTSVNVARTVTDTGTAGIATPKMSSASSSVGSSSSSWSGSLKSNTGDWTTILSTATWASAYYSHLSEASVSATATTAASNTPTTSPSSMITSLPTSTFLTSTISTSLTTIPPNNNLTITSTPETSPITNTTTTTSSTSSTASLNKSWIVGPIIGSLLGMSTVFIVIYFTRRKQNRDYLRHQPIIIGADQMNGYKYFPSSPTTSSHNSVGDYNALIGGKAQLHGESIALRELGGKEVMPPAELEAQEPVGAELIAPRCPPSALRSLKRKRDSGESDMGVEWAIQMSPLQQIFKMTEMRDEKKKKEKEAQHKTYYHP